MNGDPRAMDQLDGGARVVLAKPFRVDDVVTAPAEALRSRAG